MNEPIHIISLGAGVQSSCMSLMAAAGEILPMPAAAIFADTQAEPASVYKWLDWLEKQLPFPVHRVTSGDLSEETIRIRTSERSDETYISHNIPAYTINSDGSHGNYRRQCTDKHKLVPLTKECDRLRDGQPAIVWIGISSDEIQRMKESQRKAVTHRWPLIELQLSRQKCLAWMSEHGYKEPPRSACTFCPYHSNTEWRRLRDTDHESWNHAVEYEQRLQTAAASVPRLDGIPFLHAQRVPLSEVDLSTESERGQLDLFTEECSGMCGV